MGSGGHVNLQYEAASILFAAAAADVWCAPSNIRVQIPGPVVVRNPSRVRRGLLRVRALCGVRRTTSRAVPAAASGRCGVALSRRSRGLRPADARGARGRDLRRHAGLTRSSSSSTEDSAADAYGVVWIRPLRQRNPRCRPRRARCTDRSHPESDSNIRVRRRTRSVCGAARGSGPRTIYVAWDRRPLARKAAGS